MADKIVFSKIQIESKNRTIGESNGYGLSSVAAAADSAGSRHLLSLHSDYHERQEKTEKGKNSCHPIGYSIKIPAILLDTVLKFLPSYWIQYKNSCHPI
jgi:hypothetical protein